MREIGSSEGGNRSDLKNPPKDVSPFLLTSSLKEVGLGRLLDLLCKGIWHGISLKMLGDISLEEGQIFF